MKEISLRRWSQALSLMLFLYLLLKTAYPLAEALPVAIFLRLDPLLALSAQLASREWVASLWPSLLLILATLLLGRFFCGWLCPMGTTLDLFSPLMPRRRLEVKKDFPRRNYKYICLLFVGITSFLGLQISGWLDPISLATRTYSMVIYPYLNYLLQGLLDAFEALFGYTASGPIAFLREHLLFLKQPIFVSHGLFLLIFLAIVLLSLWARRFWCQYLCPLGALLAIFSWLSPVRRKVSNECNECGKCYEACKMQSIKEGGREFFKGECIECLSCLEACPEGAISFPLFQEGLPQLAPRGMSRRAFLGTAATAAVLLPLSQLKVGKATGNPWVIRPPGAPEEKEFLRRCLRCGQCMKVCIKNALHPTLWEAGIESMWAPQLIPRLGYCEYNCTLCGQVCPSEAIKKLTEEEKHKTVIGLAYIDKNRCIPWEAYLKWNPSMVWSEGFNCAVCEEMCPTPTKAIQFSDFWIETDEGQKAIRRPYVLEKECIGCGICENVCPVKGKAAIPVVPKGGKEDEEGKVL